uniref:Calcium uniporter regulatory subunit MCUb n=1 Tax=Erpetoichthys calabaricus TaxID=27687 RepID=A0A8C4XI85_ERPCA
MAFLGSLEAVLRSAGVQLLSGVGRSRRCVSCGALRARLGSTSASPHDVTVEYRHGLPTLCLPLPSRRETCRFSLKPLLMNVGDLLRDVQREDRGIESVAVLSPDGVRLSSAVPVHVLLRSDFQIAINGVHYQVRPPDTVLAEQIGAQQTPAMDELKDVIQRLHSALHLPAHHVQTQEKLLLRLGELREELRPLEEVKEKLMRQAGGRTSRLLWLGLAYLSAQGGALAWLTWWVYSWDIMEPVTYFLTYGSAISFYSYFVLTKQDCVYPEVQDRQFLHILHQGAKRRLFDLEKYNKLKDDVAQVECDLQRLRGPLQLQLPVEQINEKQ